MGTTNWDAIDQLRRAGASLFQEIAQELGADREVVTELKVGDASSVVAAAAERYGADLLVVGSRGLGSMGALILGSVSLRLAVHGPCPTVIVPESGATLGGARARRPGVSSARQRLLGSHLARGVRRDDRSAPLARSCGQVNLDGVAPTASQELDRDLLAGRW